MTSSRWRCGVYELGFYDGTSANWPASWITATMEGPRITVVRFYRSFSRARISQERIIAVGDDALYCDTDSVHMRQSAIEV